MKRLLSLVIGFIRNIFFLMVVVWIAYTYLFDGEVTPQDGASKPDDFYLKCGKYLQQYSAEEQKLYRHYFFNQRLVKDTYNLSKITDEELWFGITHKIDRNTLDTGLGKCLLLTEEKFEEIYHDWKDISDAAKKEMKEKIDEKVKNNKI